MRRNLDGIYILESNDPTCLSDCKPETVEAWLRGEGTPEMVIKTIQLLLQTIREMGELAGIYKD